MSILSVTDSKKKPNGYWTFERVIASAKLYGSNKEWRAKCKASYSVAQKKGWMTECTSHMEQLKRPHGYWSLERVKAAAAKYTSRTEWSKNDPTSYSSACQRGWLDQCCAHMPVKGSSHSRTIYVFEFEDRSAYVGLTFNLKKRVADHLKRPNARLKKLFARSVAYKVVCDENYYSREEATRREAETIEIYGDRGWNILNIAKAGSLGGITKYTREYCVENARQYDSLSRWRENESRVYSAAANRGWLDTCTAHMHRKKRINGYWTLERLSEDAKKYSNRVEWEKNSSGAYSKALQLKIVDQLCLHMSRKRKRATHWTHDNIRSDAAKYTTRSAWKKASSTAYKRAGELGIREVACEHMNRVSVAPGYWSRERLAREAAKYDSRIEWEKNSAASYSKACKLGIIDELATHMKRLAKPTGYWTHGRIMEDAKKFRSRKEWSDLSSTAYNKARAAGILDEACSHMVRPESHNKVWNWDKCFETLDGYKCLKAWRMNNSKAYRAACRHGWLERVHRFFESSERY